MDDDNRFLESHITLIAKELKAGNELVGVRRLYYTPQMEFIGYEHPTSELMDTNCIGCTRNFLLNAARAYRTGHSTTDKQNWFQDRQLEAYAIAHNIRPRIVSDGYSVKYITPDPKLQRLANDGKYHLIYESLLGKYIIESYDSNPLKEGKQWGS